MCCTTTLSVFHVTFWLIVRLENVSFDDYLLALEIESSFQRRRLLECKILDSLSLETEEVGVCRWCLATLVTSSEIFDFFLVCWLQKSIKAFWISEKLLLLRNAHPALWLANRWPILPVLRVCLFFSNAQLKLMSYNIRKRNMDFHMTSWAIGKMAFEVIS